MIENSENPSATKQQLESLRVLNEIAQQLYNAHNIQQIAEKAVDALTNYSQSPMVAFYILEPNKKHLALAAEHGFSEETWKKGARLPVEGSLSGITILRQEVIMSDDLLTDTRTEPKIQQALVNMGLKCAISIPIIYNNEALGVTNMIFNQKIMLDDFQRETFLSIGKTIGLSISNVRHIEQLNAEIAERKQIEVEIRKLNKELEKRVSERTAELEQRSNQLEATLNELESITYTISHDLRTPLRAINGFGKIILLDYGHLLDEQGHDYLERIRDAAQQMGELIDSLLTLARLNHREINRAEVDLSKIAHQIAARLCANQPDRVSEFIITDGITANADRSLIGSVMEHLLSNAWKFSARSEKTRIEFGETQHDNRPTYYVRDNGVGFDMQYAKKLFGTFQRLHHVDEFPGIGIGLAVVYRILQRHGGRIWAKSEPGKGTTFYFSVGDKK